MNMTITVCIGSSCHLKGSREVVEILESLISLHQLNERIDLNGSFCMEDCVNGVCVKVNDKRYSLTASETKEFFYKEILGRQEE